jgi:hypothetical protein
MNELLGKILEAHDEFGRWDGLKKLHATIVSDGALWGMKGLSQDREPREATVWLDQQRCTLSSFGDPDWHCDFTPARVVIFESDGTVVAERDNPRESFAGHDKQTPWDPLHLAYFDGYALWTYLSTPFLLAMECVEVSEVDPWNESGETWQVLRARFPKTIATHSAVQDFYFGSDLRLRRHDYRMDVAGGFDAAHLVYDYIEVEGIFIPTRRRAYLRGPNLRLIPYPVMVSIDISKVWFSCS